MPPETFLTLYSILVALYLPFNLSYPSELFTTPHSQSQCLLRYSHCVPPLCFSSVADFEPPSFSETHPQVCALECSYCPLCHPPFGPHPLDDIHTLFQFPPDLFLVSQAFFSVFHCFGPLSLSHDAYRYLHGCL